MINLKQKQIIYLFSIFGFFNGVNIGLQSVLNESSNSLYDINTILTMLFLGVIGLALIRRTTCILFHGYIHEKISFFIILTAFLLSSNNYYSPFSTSLLLSSGLFVVLHGIINKNSPRDDSRCEKFLRGEK